MKKEDRATRWAKLLSIDPQSAVLLDIEQFAEQSKPPPHVQTRIQQDCLTLQRRHHYFQEANLRNSLELLLSYYIHKERISYVSGMQEVMAPFFLMGFQRFDSVYACFSGFVNRMMPGAFQKESSMGVACKLLHKLLLYHDPALCTSLDAKMIMPAQYAEKWFLTLFANCIDFMLLISFWELALKENNLSLPLFFALVLVQKHRDQLLTRKSSSKEPPQISLEINSIEELDPLCQEAIALQHQTPKSFIRVIEEAVGRLREVEGLEEMFVMQISPEDVQIARAGNFVIDLRRSADYQRGHYPCSYNLSKDLKMTTGTGYTECRGAMERPDWIRNVFL